MDSLTVIQKSILNHLIQALLKSRQSLAFTSIQEALQPAIAYGKKDTYILDALPEVTIRDHVSSLDPKIVLVTEETAPGRWPDKPLCVIVADPTDRSAQFAEFIKRYPQKKGRNDLGDLFVDPNVVAAWEKDYGGPISITGAMTSVTCVWEDGSIIFSILLNYITGELVLVANNRVVVFDTRDKENLDFETVMSQGRPVIFPRRTIVSNSRGHLNFVTFLQKNQLYIDNLESIVLMENPKEHVYYDAPGGPSRPLYLSEFQPTEKPVGFILANGEKLPEWIGWLAFVKAAHTQSHETSLRLFEISTNRALMRDNILMSTSPPYSAFHQAVGGGTTYRIDTKKLSYFPRPSQFRETLVVVPEWNYPVVNTLIGHNYREIIL